MILQVLETTNGFCSAYKFLLEALYCLSAPRKYPSAIFCSQDQRSKKSQLQLSHKITMAVL